MNTNTTTLPGFNATQQKVNHLLSLDKITAKDLEDLNPTERQYLAETCTDMVQHLSGEKRDTFLDKINLIIPPATKSEIWEYNHSQISNVVAKFMCDHGVMPTKSTIADQTGLSRQTVAKHFKEYQQNPEYTERIDQFKLMTPNLLANVFKVAAKGDIKAARLYFEMVGAINKKNGNTVVNEQNNYIQINNTILSQENLKQLTANQLNQIESIITCIEN
ncbi:MAG: hypothetical protein V4560_09015 [Bacteroidota bacterium]